MIKVDKYTKGTVPIVYICILALNLHENEKITANYCRSMRISIVYPF